MSGLVNPGLGSFHNGVQHPPYFDPAPMQVMSTSEDLFLRIERLRSQMEKQKRKLSELVEDGQSLEKETNRLVQDMSIMNRELDQDRA